MRHSTHSRIGLRSSASPARCWPWLSDTERGGEVERHQLKWLIAVAGVAAVAFPVAFIAPFSLVANAAFYTGLFALLALPLAIGIAILRYRLYDIDRIISRTIGWAVVSGLLVAAFAILVVGLQAALVGFTQGETLAVAASTLVAFALFQPVRRTSSGRSIDGSIAAATTRS